MPRGCSPEAPFDIKQCKCSPSNFIKKKNKKKVDGSCACSTQKVCIRVTQVNGKELFLYLGLLFLLATAKGEELNVC